MPAKDDQPRARRPPATDTSAAALGIAELAMAEEWMTKVQVATFFSKSPRTIERWCAMRSAPPRVKVGATTIFHVPSMREWVTARIIGADSKRGRRA
jgi:hypothetical protein